MIDFCCHRYLFSSAVSKAPYLLFVIFLDLNVDEYRQQADLFGFTLFLLEAT